MRIRRERAGAAKLIAEYDGWSGGWNNSATTHEIAANQFWWGANIDLDVTGRASKRGGWVKAFSAAALGADGCRGLYEFLDNEGNADLLLVHYKSGTGMQLQRKLSNEFKHVRVALRGPVGVAAALGGGAGGAQFGASDHVLYVVVAESASVNYANSQAAEAAYIQQAAVPEQINVTWEPLRYAESYRVYRYIPARGWEQFDTLITGTSLVDTGSLAVSSARPTTLPVDRFPQFPGAESFAAAPEVSFTTFHNDCIFADGRALYRRGSNGIDLLPAPWQDFESGIPVSCLCTTVAGGAVAYSTAAAYTGVTSVKLTTTANGDGIELNWPLVGSMQHLERLRYRFRYLARESSKANPLSVTAELLDSGGAVLETWSVTITPSLIWKQVDLAFLNATQALNPVSTASVRVRIRQSTASAAEMYIDDMHLLVDAAEVIRPYVPTPDEVADAGANLLLSPFDPIWQCRRLAAHRNSLWLAGHPVDATYAYYSDLYRHGYYPASYVAQTETDQDDRITAIIEHREKLFVFTRDTIQRISGTVADYTSAIINDKIGCIAPFSLVAVENDLVWRARNGIYRLRTIAGVQDYFNVDRIDDTIRVTIANPEQTYAAYHDGQYKLAGTALTVSLVATSFSTVDNFILRWYRPGRIREAASWTCPDSLTAGMPLRYLVAAADGTLYAANANTGTLYKYAPTTYNDDGTAITFRIYLPVLAQDLGRPKSLYSVGLKFGQMYNVTNTVEGTVAGLTTGSFKTFPSTTIPAMDLAGLARLVDETWVEIETEIESAQFLVQLRNNVLDKSFDLRALTAKYRPLRG